MGMDAYAIDHQGRRLKTQPVSNRVHPELVDAKQQRAFSGAARVLSAMVDGIDADFDVGALCISANASAVNHVMYGRGHHCDEDGRYAPEQVLGASIDAGKWARRIPDHITADRDAMLHAEAFIATCAKLGLGIEISP